jgi:curli biogenesis system outer membrane secretion channel CsgG
LALVVILLGACASQGPTVQHQGDLTGIEKVAVLPYEKTAAPHGFGTGVRSPISGRVFVTGPVAHGAEQFLTDQLLSHVQRDTDFIILPARDAEAILNNTLADGQGRDWNRLNLLSQAGRQLGADAVMVGHVYRFRERVGGGLSVESPASVAFDIYLVDCQQERVLWSAFYDYTQQALSDNLGGLGKFLRRGGRWVTAEELATSAMDTVFEDFPLPRP